VPSGYIPPSGNSSRRASSTRPAGVRPFDWPKLDSDDDEEQMFAEIFEEEMAAAAQDEEHMLILACLLGLYAETAIGRRGGSAPGRRKCKPRQRIEGYCILYADNPLHGEAVFRHRFRISRKLFLKIVYALRDYDSYFRCKLDCTSMAGFSALQKMHDGYADAGVWSSW
jgi:hypothetical protein